MQQLENTTNDSFGRLGEIFRNGSWGKWFGGMIDSITPPVNPDRTRPWAMMGGAYEIPRGEAQREIAVRTQVDVTQQIPLTGTVTVTVNGTVNGQVNGTGDGTITGGVQAKSDAPRGETAPP